MPANGRSGANNAASPIVAVVVLAVAVFALGAAQDPSESALEAASSSRTVRVGFTASGAKHVIDLPLETYVARVLAGEGEPHAADAAQQALAIAIRTFALANRNRHQRDGFDLCDTTHCQVVRGATAVSRRAALVTAGQVLLYDGRPAEIFYSASCGGRTEAASAVWPGLPDYPYLRSIKDNVHEEDVPWVAEVTSGGIQSALKKLGFEGELKGISVNRRTTSGRVALLRLTGLRPGEVNGDDFRAAMGVSLVRSTAFTIAKTNRGFRLTGTGYGHGVGLCVTGAGRRAARGASAAEILALYYPGLQLSALAGSNSTSARGPQTGQGSFDTRHRSSMAGMPSSGPPPVMRVLVQGQDADEGRALVERIAMAAHEELGQALGISIAPVSIQLHATLDSFRRATGRPWWVCAVVSGTRIDLAPTPVLAQREGIDLSVRIAMAEVLIGDTFKNKPAWVALGAARYFAGGGHARAPLPSSGSCPSDAELTMAVSAPAQRVAEMRAEACFARAMASTPDWRQVR
jgi:stage II sporulation protein D